MRRELSDIGFTTVEYEDATIVFEEYNRGFLFDRVKARYIKCSSIEDFICGLAKERWNDCVNIAKQIKKASMLKTNLRRPNKPLTIAVYYRCISNGGAQKVTARLASLWANVKNTDGTFKYRVVLITDEQDSFNKTQKIELLDCEDSFYTAFTEEKIINEYDVDAKVIREYLPPYKSSQKEKYKDRYQKWQQIIDMHNIDIVVSGLWVEQITFWDMLSVKTHHTHPAFVIHNHNFCCVPYLFTGDTAVRLIHMYSMADAIIVLSKTDEEFVSKFSSRVRYIPNPVDFVENTDISKKDSNMLLWVGRISHEKQPLDAIKMMGYLVGDNPYLKLYMVGDGNKGLIRDIINKIKQLGLDGNVVLTGYSEDVEDYYKRASVFVSTSKYEGFPMTTIEALSCKTPVVEYTKPWLTCSGEENGIVEVEQGNIAALADAISTMIKNDNERIGAGKRAYAKYQELLNYDYVSSWNKVFYEAVYEEKAAKEMDVMFSILTEYQNAGKLAVCSQIKANSSKLQADYQRVSTSISYKLGLALTCPVRTVFHLFKDGLAKDTCKGE